MTITGTDLNLVEAAKLIWVDDPAAGDEPEVVLEGTIDTKTSEQLTVTFPTSTALRLGNYNVVTEQAGCITQVLVDGFEVSCPNPSSFTAVNPPSAPNSETTVELTITGQNFTADLSVALKQTGSGTVVTGSVQGWSSSQMVVQFDMSTAPTGWYSLTGTRADGCEDPVPLGDVFEYVDAGVNILKNGGFEEWIPADPPLAPPATAYPQQPAYWTKTKESLYGGGDFQGISNGWFGGSGPYSGNWAMGAAANYGELLHGTLHQTIDLPEGPGEYSGVTLSFRGWIWDDVANPNASWIWAKLFVDGVPVVETWLINNGLGNPPAPFVNGAWADEKKVVWSGTVTSSMVVEIDVMADARQGTWCVIVLDDVQLKVPANPCNDPFADADEDHDVDQEDFAVLQRCYTGSNRGPVPEEPAYSECFDVNGVAGDVAGFTCGVYNATIEVTGNATNSPQTIDVSVTAHSVGPDLDCDLDVDQEDFGFFQECLTGPGITQNDPECLQARLDDDEDVDQGDFAIFQVCMSGADVLANPSCAE